MMRKSINCMLLSACVLAFSSAAFATDAPGRVSSTQKGSILIYSKIEIKWDAQGELIQDTFLDISNDYPGDVSVQAFFINGDTELEEICTGEPCVDIIQEYEPGWNTADCRFTLTGDQPHFWSAANGSDKCQSFTVLDDGGRPDPETGMTSRILRGYAIFIAVDFVTLQNPGQLWLPIRWNHLKGDAVIVNYADGSAWEYNAWAIQAHIVPHGAPVDEPGAPCRIDGGVYDSAFSSLLLDFYASGSTVLSGGGQEVMVDTDLTLHTVSADLRQDGCGPILTKVEAEIWNEFETKFSGTRRCICCWDQTMLSDWVRSVAVPNHFTRASLRTDKGKARLQGVRSTECDYEALCGQTAKMKRWNNCTDSGVAGFGGHFDTLNQSDDAALLGLATKFMTFTPSGEKATAGMNLVGMGTTGAYIVMDPMFGPQESRDAHSADRTSDAKRIGTARDASSRSTVEIPAE